MRVGGVCNREIVMVEQGEDDYLELVTEELNGVVNLIKTEQRHEYRDRP